MEEQETGYTASCGLETDRYANEPADKGHSGVWERTPTQDEQRCNASIGCDSKPRNGWLGPGLHVKGDLTMGENIADLGGALVALHAYHNSLGDQPAPAIDALSGDQRFFLSYAQSWRHKSTDDSIRQQLVSNSHAPVKYRVDGVVRNMDAWYDAFNVKPSDKLFLAPENRARIW